MQEEHSSFLDSLRIASPCPKLWSEMEATATDAVRFCGDCKKNVYDVSKMPRREAELLIQRSEAGRFELTIPFTSDDEDGVEENHPSVCMQLYRRNDGTVITDDCPVGLKTIRDSWRRLKSYAVAGLAAIIAPLGINCVQAQNEAVMTKGRVSPVYNWQREANKHADIKALTDKLAKIDCKVPFSTEDALERCQLSYEIARLGDKHNLLNFANWHYQQALNLAKTLKDQSKLIKDIESALAKNNKTLQNNQSGQ